MPREKTKRITTIGGQALIEGILMRGPKKSAVSVRVGDGSIDTEEMRCESLREKYPVLAWPFIRGISGFIDSLRFSYKALEISAEKSGVEEEEASKFDQWLERHFGEKIIQFVMIVGMVLGVAVAIALFFLLPTGIFNLFLLAQPGAAPWRSIAEGVMRMLILLLYVLFCSFVPSIHRVFQYHGAEHKTIFCYENQEELTVENVRKHTRFHPRCGTSFMVIMILLGIIIGFFIPFSNVFLRTLVKILCIPIVVGIGFELIRLCGKYDNWLTRIISAPGLWMQRITTKEPDDSMIEVAIAALKEVIPENGEDIISSQEKDGR